MPFLSAAAKDGIQQVRHEDELSLHVEDMPLDGVVIMEVSCRSPPLQVGVVEASQKPASIDIQRSVTIEKQGVSAVQSTCKHAVCCYAYMFQVMYTCN